MMNELEKSDPPTVAAKPANKSEDGGGVGGAKGGGQGEHGRVEQAPDSGPGKRVTAA